MFLTPRLLTIASLVDDGVKVFDVGCDHGLLSSYLALHNHEVVATDISLDSVSKTKANFKKYGVKAIVYQKDGLEGLDINHNDTIIIAGMGTSTILKILKNHALPDTLIIQSNNNHDILRKEICKLGYYMDIEKIYKDKYLYVIIKFRKGRRKYHNFDYIIGVSNDITYYNHLLSRYQKLYNSIPKKYIYRLIKCRFIINKIKALI